MEKDIENFEGFYKIRSDGSIISLKREINRKNKSGKDSKYIVEEFLKKPDIDKHGYYKVLLSKNGNKKNFKIHVLLAKHFIPNPNNLPIVRHLNDIKTDNRLENLAWGTYSDNAFDAIKNGKRGKRESHNMSKLDEKKLKKLKFF